MAGRETVAQGDLERLPRLPAAGVTRMAQGVSKAGAIAEFRGGAGPISAHLLAF